LSSSIDNGRDLLGEGGLNPSLECGLVVEAGEGMILVEAEAGSFCHGCAASSSCAMIGGSKKRRIWMRDTLGARVGDMVTFYVPPRAVVAGSLILYALPVTMLGIGIFLGGRLGEWLDIEGEAAGLIGGAVGLIMSCILIFILTNRLKKKRAYEPLLKSVRGRD